MELLPDFNQMIAAVGHQCGFIRDSNLQAIRCIPGEHSNPPPLLKNASTELYGSNAWLQAHWLWGFFVIVAIFSCFFKASLSQVLQPSSLGRETVTLP